MNTVLIQLNSYIGQAKVYLNGSEPSSYSELSNYSYQQFIHDPAEILASIARELNDDFTLQLCANAFLFRCYLSASSTEDLCLSCTSVTAALPLSSSERALRLGNALPTQELTAFITGDGISEPEDCPDRLSYGNLTVKIVFAEPEEPFTRIDMGHIEWFTPSPYPMVTMHHIVRRKLLWIILESSRLRAMAILLLKFVLISLQVMRRWLHMLIGEHLSGLNP